MAMRFLLMTDSPVLAHHFAVVCAGRGNVSETPCGPIVLQAGLLPWLTERRPDALLLDLMPAQRPRSVAVLAQWRALCPGVPVMVVLADGSLSDRLKLLQAGADGCHNDAVDARVLAARVEALVRRHQGFSGPSLECPPFSLEPQARRVSIEGQLVPVTGYEFQVLEILVRHRGQVLSRTDILSRVGPEALVNEARSRSLYVIYWRIRRRFSAFPRALAMLQHRRGEGFVLDPRA
ncbi:Transcriptional regulatory protein phoP [Serratia proteamaculans]|uniref:response regulator transcription factor n=1 Tax=Serratia proteamaculans TaxID=28151 RepID=UPI002182F44D|nr:response regulator transcription factor [Serratia proteamaculans]CAI2534137.1 Transcriptional regulatory protein phoP [Serratia proteamaculans]